MYEQATGPLGPIRFDYLFASIVQAIAETNRDPKKKSSPWKIEDFMVFDMEREVDEREPWEKTLSTLKDQWK